MKRQSIEPPENEGAFRKLMKRARRNSKTPERLTYKQMMALQQAGDQRDLRTVMMELVRRGDVVMEGE